MPPSASYGIGPLLKPVGLLALRDNCVRAVSRGEDAFQDEAGHRNWTWADDFLLVALVAFILSPLLRCSARRLGISRGRFPKPIPASAAPQGREIFRPPSNIPIHLFSPVTRAPSKVLALNSRLYIRFVDNAPFHYGKLMVIANSFRLLEADRCQNEFFNRGVVSHDFSLSLPKSRI